MSRKSIALLLAIGGRRAGRRLLSGGALAGPVPPTKTPKPTFTPTPDWTPTSIAFPTVAPTGDSRTGHN